MIRISHGYFENLKGDWKDISRYSPISQLTGYKLRFLDVDPENVDGVVDKIGDHFNIQEVHLYQGLEGNTQTVITGPNYHELVIEIKFWKKDIDNEDNEEKYHKEVVDTLMSKLNLYDELLFLHPVHNIIDWKIKTSK